MKENPWSRINDLAAQIELWSASRLGLEVIKGMAEEILMQVRIIEEEEKNEPR